MPIEIYFRGPKGEVPGRSIEPGLPFIFRDYSEGLPVVISAVCADDSKSGEVYHVKDDTQARSGFNLISAEVYNEENLSKKLTLDDNTYERDLVTKGGNRVRLILRLVQES